MEITIDSEELEDLLLKYWMFGAEYGEDVASLKVKRATKWAILKTIRDREIKENIKSLTELYYPQSS